MLWLLFLFFRLHLHLHHSGNPSSSNGSHGSPAFSKVSLALALALTLALALVLALALALALHSLQVKFAVWLALISKCMCTGSCMTMLAAQLLQGCEMKPFEQITNEAKLVCLLTPGCISGQQPTQQNHRCAKTDGFACW